MDQKMKYKCADRSRQRRLRRCTDVSDPEDLRAELGAARLLALEAMEQGNSALADRLLTGIGKLAQTQVTVKAKRNEYLEKAVVRRLLADAVDILARVVEGKFPGWEIAFEQAADEIMHNVAATTNEDKQ